MTEVDVKRELALHGRFMHPGGVIPLAETVDVPSGAIVSGHGPRYIFKVAGDYPAFRIVCDDPEGITLCGFKVTRASGRASGIVLYGRDLLVENVWIENCLRGIEMAEFDAKSRNVVMRRVRVSHSAPTASTSQFGIMATHVDGLVVEDCDLADAWLDGLKLYKWCRDVRVLRGRFHHNGKAYAVNGTAGEGIDCFTGGEDVVIDGTVLDHNGGSGLIIKTSGPHAGMNFNPEFGRQRNFTLRDIVARDNVGAGIGIEGVYDSGSVFSPRLDSAAEDDRPRAAQIEIISARCENNGLHGLFLNGLDIQVQGGVMRANGLEGIRIGENARDVRVADTSIIGCGTAVAAGAALPVTVELGADRIHFDRVLMDAKDGMGDAVHAYGITSFTGTGKAVARDCRNLNATASSDAFREIG